MGTHVVVGACTPYSWNIGFMNEYPNRFQWLFSPYSIYRAFGREVNYIF
jgi:hypothetical protein